MPPFFYLHAEKSRGAQGGKKDQKKKKNKPTNPKQKNRFITVNACAHQLKQQLPTRLPDTSFPPEKHPKIILYGVWGIYIRALHTSPKSILIKPSSPVHDTSGQDRNQKRSHASNCSCNTFRAKEVSSLKAEPFTPNHTQKQRIQLPKASPASTCILLPTASDSRIPASLPALPALSSCSDMAAFTQSTSGVSSEDWVRSLNALPDQQGGCSTMAKKKKWKKGSSRSLK